MSEKNKPYFKVSYPENGDYTFMLYSTDKINNPIVDITFRTEKLQ